MKRVRGVTALIVAAMVVGVSGTALSATSSTIGVANVARLKQRWKGLAGMGGGLGFRSPVVANGRLYVGNDYGRVMVYSAKAPDAYCWASPRQCQPVWYGLTGSAILGTPVVTGGKVYVQSRRWRRPRADGVRLRRGRQGRLQVRFGAAAAHLQPALARDNG